jgi:hypothetical protein
MPEDARQMDLATGITKVDVTEMRGKQAESDSPM